MKNIYDDEDFFCEYAKMERSQGGLEKAGEWYQLKRLIPDLKGKKVLDLGCGYGWHCKEAVLRGATYVLGMDISEKMIHEAKIRNADEKIEYRICGIDEYEYPIEEFDFVISNLVLHYVEDLEAIYRLVFRTLKQNGVFLFNIEHPIFTGSVNQQWICDDQGNALYWPVDNYFYGELEKLYFFKKRS